MQCGWCSGPPRRPGRSVKFLMWPILLGSHSVFEQRPIEFGVEVEREHGRDELVGSDDDERAPVSVDPAKRQICRVRS